MSKIAHGQGPDFDTLDFIMRWENGECNDDETIAGFQKLIDTGLAWRLQGCYGRTASQLIATNVCHPAYRDMH